MQISRRLTTQKKISRRLEYPCFADYVTLKFRVISPCLRSDTATALCLGITTLVVVFIVIFILKICICTCILSVIDNCDDSYSYNYNFYVVSYLLNSKTRSSTSCVICLENTIEVYILDFNLFYTQGVTAFEVKFFFSIFTLFSIMHRSFRIEAMDFEFQGILSICFVIYA